MNNIKVSTKLLILVVIMSLITCIIGIYGERNLKIVNDSVETVYKESVVPLDELNKILDQYTVNIIDATNKLRNGNISWETERRNLRKAKEEIEINWKSYTTTLTSEERDISNEIRQLMIASDESI